MTFNLYMLYEFEALGFLNAVALIIVVFGYDTPLVWILNRPWPFDIYLSSSRYAVGRKLINIYDKLEIRNLKSYTKIYKFRIPIDYNFLNISFCEPIMVNNV